MSLKIVGLSINTSYNQVSQDLGTLWCRIFTENSFSCILNKVSDQIYSIYTDYESNYTGNYTAIVGVEVKSLENVPEGFIGREFQPQTFKTFTAKGAVPKSVADTWAEIWKLEGNLQRAYTYDYELYTEKSRQGEESEVDIFIAIK